MKSNNEVFEKFIHIKKTVDDFVMLKNKESEEILFWDESVPGTIDYRSYQDLKQSIIDENLPSDVEEYVLQNSIFITLYEPEKLIRKSYSILLKVPINWVFSKPMYISPKNLKNNQDIQIFKKKDNESFANLQKNVQYHFLAKLLLSATPSYPDFKRKEHMLKSFRYAYENVGVSDFRHTVSSSINSEEIDYCLSNEYAIYSSLLAYNKNIGESVMEELSKSSELSVIHSLLRQKTLSTRLIGKVYKDHKDDRLVNILAVIHKNCPEFVIEELYKSNDEELIKLAMMNVNFNESILRKIANRENVRDKRIVSKNNSIPLSYLEKWLNNEKEDPVVRFNAFCNQSIPTLYKNIYNYS